MVCCSVIVSSREYMTTMAKSAVRSRSHKATQLMDSVGDCTTADCGEVCRSAINARFHPHKRSVTIPASRPSRLTTESMSYCVQGVELQPMLRLQQPGVNGRHVDLPAKFAKNMSSISANVPMAADQKPALGNGSWLVQASLNGGHDFCVASNDTDSVKRRLTTSRSGAMLQNLSDCKCIHPTAAAQSTSRIQWYFYSADRHTECLLFFHPIRTVLESVNAFEELLLFLCVQVVEVSGPTVSMRTAYFKLRRDQQIVTLHAHLHGARPGMRPVSTVVSVDQRTASGTDALDEGSISLKSAALRWNSGSNASQPIVVRLPAVSCLASVLTRCADCANGVAVCWPCIACV